MILSEAREQLFDAVVPTIDSQENIDRFDRYLNLVQERYLNSGKWTGMVRELVIVAFDGYFTLPARFVAVLAAKGCCGPIAIANRWFVYRYGGCYIQDPSVWENYGYGGVDDMGDGFVTFRDSPYAAYFLRFTRASADDVGMQVLVKGYDGQGNPIFTDNGQSYEGMTVTLDQAVVTTSQAFAGRIEYLKKLRSHGYLYLDAVDTLTGAVTRIGYYSPSETAPSYHRYWIGCKNDEPMSAAALCKLRYTPAVVDSDEVVPSNSGALRAGLAALKCEAEGDLVRRDLYFQDGIKMLSDEARENRGGARFSLRIDPNCYQFFRLWPGR